VRHRRFTGWRVPVGAEAVHEPVQVDTVCRGRVGGREGVRGRTSLCLDILCYIVIWYNKIKR